MRNWVKIEGSDVRLEYPDKRVDHPDGEHFHYEPDKTQPARRVSIPPTLLEDHGNGTYTSWSCSLWGPVGQRGTLNPGVRVVPLKGRRDREAALRLEDQLRRALDSQAALAGMARSRQE